MKGIASGKSKGTPPFDVPCTDYYLDAAVAIVNVLEVERFLAILI